MGTSDVGSPNILLMWSDEQRVDTVGSYGPVYGQPGNPIVRTPHIDSLAARGTRFLSYYTPYPLCSPARASTWTSLYPHQHDVLGNKRDVRLPTGFIPPVAILRDAGYYTGYVGKWHVPGASPEDLGFTDARALGRKWGRDIPQYQAYLREKGYRIDPSPHNVENLSPEEFAMLRAPDTPSCGTSALPLHDYLEWWVTDRVIELLQDASSSGQPFFVVCGWNAPHFPMLVPAPYDALYDPADVPLPPSFDDDLHGKPEAQKRRPSHTRVQHLSPDGWRKLIAHYWGLVSLVDEQVGRLLAALDRLGVAENTIVVYTTDHGDMMGSHHLMEKGAWNVYEETVRLPLVLHDPRNPSPPSTLSPLVSQLDLVPTLLEMAGVQPPPGLAGRSAASLLSGQRDGYQDAIFGETAALSERPGVDPELPQEALDPETTLLAKWVRTDQHKYAAYSNDRDELYDLETDPLEMRNLAYDPDYASMASELRTRLLAWMQETNDPVLPRMRNILVAPTDAQG